MNHYTQGSAPNKSAIKTALKGFNGHYLILSFDERLDKYVYIVSRRYKYSWLKYN